MKTRKAWAVVDQSGEILSWYDVKKRNQLDIYDTKDDAKNDQIEWRSNGNPNTVVRVLIKEAP